MIPEEQKEILDRIQASSICFRIDIDKAEALIDELTRLEHAIGSDEFAKKYPTLHPMREWIGVLLLDFLNTNLENYQRYLNEREETEKILEEHFKNLK